MTEEKKKTEAKEEVKSTNNTFNDVWNKFTNTISGMYKKPLTTIKEETEKPNTRDTWVMLIAIAVSFALIMMTGFKSVMSISMNGISIDDMIEVPYFKIFAYAVIIYLVMSFIPIVVSFLVSRIMKEDSFDFKKSMSLYAVSMSVVIPTNLIMAILCALDLLTWVGAILVAVVNIMSFFNYVLGYVNLIKMDDNKKPYALTGIVIAWVIVTIICLAIAGKSLVSSAEDAVKDASHSRYSEVLDW